MSTDSGANLTADALVGVLATHQDRLVTTWQGFSPEQWDHPSRNETWSVHDTARHVADAMEATLALVLGEPQPFSIEEFDPRTTPDVWLAMSGDDSPSRTIERYATAADRLRDRVGERVTAGDASIGTTVYGPAHWSVAVVHLFWDSWLHERDVLLPLGLTVHGTIDEQRLAGVYGLLMTMVPPKIMAKPFSAVIEYTGPAGRTVAAAHEDGRLSSIETEPTDTELTGDLCALVDALSGRGTPIAELLPTAPDLLGFFAGFMST